MEQSNSANINSDLISAGFSNPAYTELMDLEAKTAENREHNGRVMDSLEKNQSYSLSLENLKLINSRASNSLATQEMDYVCCNTVYTIRTRTYVYFKKSVQILKPFLVLVVMIVILVFLFRLDILTGNVEDDDE